MPNTSTETKKNISTKFISLITICISIFVGYKTLEYHNNKNNKEKTLYQSIIIPDKNNPSNIETKKYPLEKITTLPTNIKETPLPKSLEGTSIDGSLEADDNGHLIISLQNKYLFDYFLSLLGEESQEQVLARLTQHINQSLPEPAASQAITLFNNYISLKHGLRELEEKFPAAQDIINFNEKHLTQRLDALHQLRISHLGPESADAFFSQSENYDRVQIEILRINRGEYDDNEKRRLALEAEAQLPQHLQQRRQHKRQLMEVSKITGNLQKNDASEEDLFSARAAHVNYEFAERMAIVDQEKKDWKSRVTNYQKQRQQILNNDGLAHQDKLSSISALRSDIFSNNEIKRINAMDNAY